MKLSGNTILITGGSSGIGLELSKQLLKSNNKIIICGKTKEKLHEVKKTYPEIAIFQCDISDEEQCFNLANWIKENHSDLNVLINNAAIVHISQFMDDDDIIKKGELEMKTNFFGPLRLIKLLSPIIESNNNPTLINITTGLVYVPRADYPFYNSTKSALHSFTQTLRIQLSKTNFKIIEVMFPAVNTPWHKGSPPKIAISSETAVREMVKGISSGKTEIKVAKVKLLYLLSRIAPNFALKKINNLAK